MHKYSSHFRTVNRKFFQKITSVCVAPKGFPVKELKTERCLAKKFYMEICIRKLFLQELSFTLMREFLVNADYR